MQEDPNPPRCPDCGTAMGDGRFTHNASCPAGRSAVAAMRSDRKWFLRHPGATERLRPMAWGELAEFRALGADLPEEPGSPWMALVTQVEPGVRTRKPCQSVALKA